MSPSLIFLVLPLLLIPIFFLCFVLFFLSSFSFSSFLKWRIIVVVTLLLLYTGYYFNRSNVSVATPQILEDTGLNKTDFGTVLRSPLLLSI